MELIRALIKNLQEAATSPIQVVNTGTDTFYRFVVDGVPHSVSQTTFIDDATESDGKSFRANWQDNGRTISRLLPLQSEYGKAIIQSLKDSGYDMTWLDIAQDPSDYRDPEQGFKGMRESVRKVDSFTLDNKKAVVYLDSDEGEFIVKFFTDGKHNEDADYFTDDKHDAVTTAKKHTGAK